MNRHDNSSVHEDHRGTEENHDHNHERGGGDSGSGGHHGHGQHHATIVTDFRRRFWISLVLTIPVVVLAPMIQGLLDVREALRLSGDSCVQWALASAILSYGGWPFLKGLADEAGKKNAGMMTLIALAITVA